MFRTGHLFYPCIPYQQTSFKWLPLADTVICLLHSNELFSAAVVGVKYQTPLVTEKSRFCFLSPALPFFFFLLQWCVAAITDNGRNIKGNKQTPAASWAVIWGIDATCILQKPCLLHAFSTRLRFMLNANAVVGDWKCVCTSLGWSLEVLTLVTLSECTWPARPQRKKKGISTCLHEATLHLFSCFFP